MIEVRRATTDQDDARIAHIVSTVSPDDPISVEEMRWSDRAYPGGQRFVAWLDGTPVGAGGAGRVHMYPPEYDALWGNISVLPEHRRRGVGGSLLAALSDVARAAGKSTLMGRTSEDEPAAIEFLAHRGIHEYERMKVVRLDLAGLVAPPIDPPAGIAITTLEAQPELVTGVYAVSQEALPDIPGEGPMAPESIEEFRKRDVDRPSIPAGAFMVAVEAASGQVVGYANLMLAPGRATVAWHGMTGVARAWRGRGVAGALKRATIAWAMARGLEALEGANDIDNAAMRAVNARLGYRPRPDEIGVRGPILP
jgi:GNAT superfamily N-acetyltransferase